MSEYSLKKENIDPSDYSEEELREIIFHGSFCAKILEKTGTTEAELRQAYGVIENIDQLPHERTPSDLILENAPTSES